MVNEIAVQNTLSAKEIKAQVQLIQSVMKEIMIGPTKENRSGVHYGIIPGCNKPTLYKPGAEKILSTFKLAVDPEISDLSTTDEIRYRVRARITSMVSGAFIGCGVGECSSNEEKYMWRKSVCDQEFEETLEDRRREKWYSPYNGSPYKVKQVRTNVADIANTILKMAKKRALIDGVLTSTAASDIFEQDLEDLPEELRQQGKNENGGKPEVAPPQQKTPPKYGKPIISEKQGKRLLAIAFSNNYTKEEVEKYVKENYSLERLSEITTDIYDQVVSNFEAKKDV